jgi:hypothetical protein
MTWVLLGVSCIVVVVLLARRSRKVSVSSSEPISTIHSTSSRKKTDKEKAALEAATRTLR